MPLEIVRVLQTPRDGRTVAQTAALSKWYRHRDAEWQKLNRVVQEHLKKTPQPATVKALISSEGLKPVRLHSQGADFSDETHFLTRGDTRQKAGVAPVGFLQVLTATGDATRRWSRKPPEGSPLSYRRTGLANWMTDVEHGAGHLLARVIVNRLWQHHMGRGIVATPSDFGARGERPTHPDLLDRLAGELVRNEWRLKPIHKLILNSAVYRQNSQFDERKAAVDRENRLYWRQPVRRLEAEVIRDTLLAVGNRLDDRMHGPGTLDPAGRRRSIYLTVKRSKLMPMMQVFDAPDALSSIGARPSTTIAPQALLMMNNPHVRASAKSFAASLVPLAEKSPADAVRSGYLRALSRHPTDDELNDNIAFLKLQMVSYRNAGKTSPMERALTDFCQVLMCLNEFAYIE